MHIETQLAINKDEESEEEWICGAVQSQSMQYIFSRFILKSNLLNIGNDIIHKMTCLKQGIKINSAK